MMYNVCTLRSRAVHLLSAPKLIHHLTSDTLTLMETVKQHHLRYISSQMAIDVLREDLSKSISKSHSQR